MIKKGILGIYLIFFFVNLNTQQNANSSRVSIIKKFIQRELKDDLKNIEQENRKFIFKEVDLDDDGKNEIFVGFINSYFCGSGGCTALLFANDGKVINRFTVVDFPFSVLSEKTFGWKNLSVKSNKGDKLLKFNGKKYPSNSSVIPKSNKLNLKNAIKVLGYDRNEYQFFDF